MDFPSEPFLVPLIFTTISGSRDRLDRSNFIEGNGSITPSSVLASWGPEEGGRMRGSVIGLEDGSIVILPSLQRQEAHEQLNLKTPVHLARSTSPSSPSRMSVSRTSLMTSRSPSPSGHSPSPFSVNMRSRIVSGVTTEQVEAPKNYVDFDEEADKLKDMLKGHAPKEKEREKERNVDRPPSVDGGSSGDKMTPGNTESSAIKRKDAPRSHLSVSGSHAFTTSGHVLLPCRGPRKSVSNVQLFSDLEVIAVLQESGHLCILHSTDGRSLTTTHLNNTNLLPPEGVSPRNSQHDLWIWDTLRAYCAGEYTLLVACASLDPNSSSFTCADSPELGGSEQCRLVVLELRTNHLAGAFSVTLEKLGQWYCDSSSKAVELYWTPEQALMFCYINTDNHFVEQKLHIVPPGVIPNPAAGHAQAFRDRERDHQSAESLPLNLSHALGPLANPFKQTKRTEQTTGVSDDSSPQPGRVTLGPAFVSTEAISAMPHRNYRFAAIEGLVRGLVWSDQEVVAFMYEKRSFRVLFACQWQNIIDCAWFENDQLVVAFEDKCELYSLRNVVDANNDVVKAASLKELPQGAIVQPKLLLQTFITEPYDSVELTSSRHFMMTLRDSNGRRVLKSFHWNDVSDEGQLLQLNEPKNSTDSSRIIWSSRKSSVSRDQSDSIGTLSAVMPLSVNLVILGYTDGRLRQTTLTKMCQDPGSNWSSFYGKTSEVSLGAPVVILHLVKSEKTNERLMVGGGDDGSVGIWNMDLKLCAYWTIFLTLLTKVIQFDEEDLRTSPLRGCILCVSEDGTIAVVALDSLQFLYIIPGSPTPLHEIWLKEDENHHHHLLLLYTDRRVRLWDVKTKEFWRSMASDKAEELKSQGGWKVKSLDKPTSSPSPLSVIGSHDQGLDSVSTLVLNMEHFISESTTVIKSISTSKNQTANILAARDRLKAILSVLLTPGINPSIDEICEEQLGIVVMGDVSVGFHKLGCTSLYQSAVSEQPWRISGEVSATRALAIIVSLRALGIFEEFSDAVSTVSAFYTTSLGSLIGPSYKPPDLAYLAQKWFDAIGSVELRHAVRTLFDAAVVRLSDEETIALVNEWQQHLPSLQPEADQESRTAALSLFLCGYLAAEKYSLFSTSALTDITKSISLYLHSAYPQHSHHAPVHFHPSYLILAIDLSSRGFHVWQHYMAVEILRRLFVLATSARKELMATTTFPPPAPGISSSPVKPVHSSPSPSKSNPSSLSRATSASLVTTGAVTSTTTVSAVARNAVLAIAGREEARGLFVMTLGMEITGTSSLSGDRPSSTTGGAGDGASASAAAGGDKDSKDSVLEHRKAVLQILAFLIRKRPLVLLPNLPKLLEAVVKSLDPNSTGGKDRDAVLDTVTEILGHVVKTFPSIDFHVSSQRLAVGTSEGTIVMYDLKTAIRLYVLEAHKEPITACSFSPDGRRLVTLSLKESVALVWKVGSSFSSFFNPGAPPRQSSRTIGGIGGWGGTGGTAGKNASDGDEPYKKLGFNVGEEGIMTTAETLKFVSFDWVADRSVKLKIRESILTFNT